MPPREPYRNRIELLQGTLDMLILQTLRWGPQHGYGIAQAVRHVGGDADRPVRLDDPADFCRERRHHAGRRISAQPIAASPIMAG